MRRVRRREVLGSHHRCVRLVRDRIVRDRRGVGELRVWMQLSRLSDRPGLEHRGGNLHVRDRNRRRRHWFGLRRRQQRGFRQERIRIGRGWLDVEIDQRDFRLRWHVHDRLDDGRVHRRLGRRQQFFNEVGQIIEYRLGSDGLRSHDLGGRREREFGNDLAARVEHRNGPRQFD